MPGFPLCRAGLTSDQTIELTGVKPTKLGLPPLRRVGYRDPETGKHYEFLTNHFGLSARTIAEIYRQRWQVELFFKWIKQNLKIKSFIGQSKNAVLTQIRIASLYVFVAGLHQVQRQTWLVDASHAPLVTA